MRPLRAIIVDDESACRERLRRLLAPLPHPVEIVGEATNAAEAELLLKQTDANLVFLDIVLPGMDGMTLASRLGRRPSIVFVTGHADRAVEAFDTFALHYLLKPVDPEALERALAKVMTAAPVGYRTRIPCRAGNRVDLLDIQEVLFFQADHKYTLVRPRDPARRDTRSTPEYLVDIPLVGLEETLDPNMFLRVSRSAIVNVRWIAGYTPLPDGRAEIHIKDHDQVSVSVSRNHLQDLKSLI